MTNSIVKGANNEAMEAVKKPEVKRKYYCYHGMTISIVWLTDEEYLDFIRKHWSSTLVRSTAYERKDDSGEPGTV